MRILILHSRSLSGSASGENRVVEDEARLLREAGHAVRTWTPSPAGARGLGLVRVGLGAVWSTPSAAEVRALIRRHRAEIVHCHNLFPALSPAVVRTAAAEPAAVVVSLHNYRLLCLPALFLREGGACEDCLGRLPRRGVVRRLPRSGGAARRSSRSHSRRSGNPSRAGAPLDELARERIDHAWFAERKIPPVVTVGDVVSRNDHETLVLAMARAPSLLPDPLRPRLAIIIRTWSDAYEEKVRRLVHGLDLDGALELLGYQESPPRFVVCATNCASSSVSTDCPSGSRWLLDDGKCGLLAPVRSPAKLGDAIARLIDDQALRGRLVSRVYRRVDEFTPRRVAERYLDVAGLARSGRS